MKNPQIESLLLAWLALDAGPEEPRPASKARDGILDLIADYFSVKPTPLVAYLRGVTDPTVDLVADARFTFRHKLQVAAAGLGCPGDVRSRLFLSDLARVHSIQYVDVLTSDNERLATLRRPEKMFGTVEWVMLVGNVLGAYVASGVEIRVLTDSMTTALPIDMSEHTGAEASRLAQALSGGMLGRAKSIGDYRIAREAAGPIGGGLLHGREGLIAAVGTMEERINENLKEQLGKPQDEATLADAKALFGIDAVSHAAGSGARLAGDKGTLSPAQTEEVIKNTPQPEGME